MNLRVLLCIEKFFLYYKRTPILPKTFQEKNTQLGKKKKMARKHEYFAGYVTCIDIFTRKRKVNSFFTW